MKAVTEPSLHDTFFESPGGKSSEGIGPQDQPMIASTVRFDEEDANAVPHSPGHASCPAPPAAPAGDFEARVFNLSLLAVDALEQLRLTTVPHLAGGALELARSIGIDEAIAVGLAAAVLTCVRHELSNLEKAEQLVLRWLPAVQALETPEVVAQGYATLVRIAQHRTRNSDNHAQQPARQTGPRASERLSTRECAVLSLIAKGQSNKRVAQTLKITPETVKSHLKRIFVKLGSKTRAEAVARATGLGFAADIVGLSVSPQVKMS